MPIGHSGSDPAFSKAESELSFSWPPDLGRLGHWLCHLPVTAVTQPLLSVTQFLPALGTPSFNALQP